MLRAGLQLQGFLFRSRRAATQRQLLSPLSPLAPAPQQQQVRHNFQMFQDKYLDRTTGTWKIRRWVDRLEEVREPTKMVGSRKVLLYVRNWKQKRHVPDSQLKRKATSLKVYRRAIKRVADLARYVKFVEKG